MRALDHRTIPERPFRFFQKDEDGAGESVYQHVDLQIMFLFRCLLIVSGCSWRWSTRRRLQAANHDGAHIPSSVIMRGTLPSRLNLFVLPFFQARLHLKRTDTTLLFWSSLSTWLFVQQSRKMHPVHVPSDRHAAHPDCMQEAERELHL